MKLSGLEGEIQADDDLVGKGCLEWSEMVTRESESTAIRTR